ncbi:MAG: DUF4232 domain-containing protein [Candidatus Dormibacteria bacterium]
MGASAASRTCLSIGLLAGILITLVGCEASPTPSPSPSATATSTTGPAPTTTTSPLCTGSQVTGQFRYVPVGMSKVMEGITFTNASPATCTVPEFPNTLALQDAAGNAVPAVPIQNPLGTATGDRDFFDYGSASAPAADFPAALSSASTTGIRLNPGDRAVIAMFGKDFMSSNQTCLAGRPGDQMAVHFGSQTTLVTIPTSAAFSGSGTKQGTGRSRT